MARGVLILQALWWFVLVPSIFVWSRPAVVAARTTSLCPTNRLILRFRFFLSSAYLTCRLDTAGEPAKWEAGVNEKCWCIRTAGVDAGPAGVGNEVIVTTKSSHLRVSVVLSGFPFGRKELLFPAGSVRLKTASGLQFEGVKVFRYSF